MKLSFFVLVAALLVAPATQVAEAQQREVCGHNRCPDRERRGGHYDDRRGDHSRNDHRRGATIFGGSVVLDLRIGPQPRSRSRVVIVEPRPRRHVRLCPQLVTTPWGDVVYDRRGDPVYRDVPC
jgi:hypothetical protein